MILMPFMGGSFGLTFLALPFFAIQLLFLSSAFALWLSAITVQCRDVRFVVPFMVQFGMFVSPVGYSSDLIPNELQWIYFLNPLVGIIDGFRFSLLGVASTHFIHSIASSLIVTVTLFLSGYFYFRKKERAFADII